MYVYINIFVVSWELYDIKYFLSNTNNSQTYLFET